MLQSLCSERLVPALIVVARSVEHAALSAACAITAATTRRFGRWVETHDTRGLRPLGLFDNFELDLFALVENFEAIAVDRAVMHEDIRTALALKEAVALLLREPLNSTVGTSHR